MYYGWADNVSSARGTIDSTEAWSARWSRRGVDPGTITSVPRARDGTLQGGPGTGTFDPVAALTAWVEHGQAPDRITATQQTAGKVDRVRPDCPYRQQARSAGSGDREDAASYVCAEGPPVSLRRLQDPSVR